MVKSHRSSCRERTWTRAAVAAGSAPRARSFGEAAVLRRWLRSWAVVSADLRVSRVVGMRIRCEVRERVVRNSSMRRWQMPRPTPLRGVWCEYFVCVQSRAGSRAYLFAPVTRAKKVSLAGTSAHGAAAIGQALLGQLFEGVPIVDSMT